jgi:DNA-binding MarR family transcriptional regulator
VPDKGVRSRPSTEAALGVDDILGQWRRERPDLDPIPIALFGMIARVYLISRRHINGTLKEFGLTREMFDVLATLRRSGPPYQLTPTQLSRSLVLTGPGMTNRLDRLEESGLVLRLRSSGDRRSVQISLTAEGFKLIEEVTEQLAHSESQLIAAFAPEKATQLIGLLEELTGQLRQNEARTNGAR